MTQEEILQYNKRCAEFLGVDKTVSSYYLPQFGLYKNKYGEVYYEEVFMDDELKFHSDWNWIHEVIQSIKNTTNPKEQYGTTFSTLRREIQVHLGRSNKEAVVEAINQFLIWYSQNKTV